MKQIEYQGTTYRVPFADLFRALTTAEEAELRASIRDTRVYYPVLVFDSAMWGPDCVIDGAHRLQVAADEGVAAPVEKRDVTDVEARRLAEDLNIARRHLTPDETKAARAARIKRVIAMRGQGMSTRAIANEERVSQTQICIDLKPSGEQGYSPEAAPPTGDATENADTNRLPASERPKIRGKDGKKYSAQKSKKTTEVKQVTSATSTSVGTGPDGVPVRRDGLSGDPNANLATMNALVRCSPDPANSAPGPRVSVAACLHRAVLWLEQTIKIVKRMERSSITQRASEVASLEVALRQLKTVNASIREALDAIREQAPGPEVTSHPNPKRQHP